jgi:hypothetical protein
MIDLAAIGLIMPMRALYARLAFDPGPAAAGVSRGRRGA